MKIITCRNTFSGPILEEGLIIGFSILAFLIIIGIIFGVLDWAQNNLEQLGQQLGGI